MKNIEINNLTVTYDQKPVLYNVKVNIPYQKITCIIGPNGAGKSTFIKSLINIVKPLTGSITFNNKTYKDIKKSIAYVPQRSSFDWDFPVNVFDVVMMGRYGEKGLFKRIDKSDYEIVENALKMVGLFDYKNRQISNLSGGQQQRVFIARAIAQNAEIYLLDEPLQGVDIYSEKTIINILKELQKNGKTIIVVHHNLNNVIEYFDYSVFLNSKVVASGYVKDVFTKENIDKTYLELE